MSAASASSRTDVITMLSISIVRQFFHVHVVDAWDRLTLSVLAKSTAATHSKISDILSGDERRKRRRLSAHISTTRDVFSKSLSAG